MTVLFPRVDAAFGACDRHLSALDPANPDAIEIESALVSFLVVLVVSEYETFLAGAFAARADKCGDTHVASFVRKQIARKFRSPDLRKITETLGAFGSDYLSPYRTSIENTAEHAAWDNMMRARHAIVHQQGSLYLTYRELKATYPRTRRVVEELISILGIP